MSIPTSLNGKTLHVTEVIRNGPRFFIAKVAVGSKTYLFKSLYESARNDDNVTTWARNLEREILFLQWFQEKHIVQVPKMTAYELLPSPWYMREDVSGELQSYEGSDFLFKESFFNSHSLAFADFFTLLRSLTDQLPNRLHSLTKNNDSPEALYEGMVLYHLGKITEHLPNFFEPALIDACKNFYDTNKQFYFDQRSALSHTEPYASNIFKKEENLFVLIDWERLEQVDPSHDIAILWIRGFENQQWQSDLLRSFIKQYDDEATFWILFRFNIVTQQLGNIVHFIANTAKAEGKKAKRFLPFAKESIIQAVYQDSF